VRACFAASPDVARCTAAESIHRALDRAVAIVFRNFKVPGDPPRFYSGGDCASIRAGWGRSVAEILGRIPRGARRSRVVASCLKSCSRLFDAPCLACDTLAASRARADWMSCVSDMTEMKPTSEVPDPIGSLERRFAVLVDGWDARLSRARENEEGERPSDVYVPDQQGCLEKKRGEGGTLAVPAEWRSPHNHLRVGVAKTKGKHRVVTMQSAFVKRVLTPVHQALYDHISSFGWCVRGDVTSGDFEDVFSDRRDGESIISGDYSQATNKIYAPAVEAMVRVLLRSSRLTEDEREVLMGSFRDIRYCVDIDGERTFVPIHRGQMMGNLVSFPLLCLLNKVCFDLTVDLTFVPGTRRVGRFNGDDCLFSGDRPFFELWQRVTAVYGFEVNVEKTGFSPRFGELNSRVYDFWRHRFFSKPCLSFLRPVDRNAPGDILSGIVENVRTLRNDVQEWIVNVIMRYEISLREVSLSSLPARWFRSLIRRRWFRDLLGRGSSPTRATGVDRSVPVVQGPPPRPSLYPVVTSLASSLTRRHVDRFRGLSVRPFRVSLDRRSIDHSPLPRSPWRLGVIRSWSFLWPRDLYEAVLRRCPQVLLSPAECSVDWIDDHPFLQASASLGRLGVRRGCPDFRAVPDPTVSGVPVFDGSRTVVYCEQ